MKKRFLSLLLSICFFAMILLACNNDKKYTIKFDLDGGISTSYVESKIVDEIDDNDFFFDVSKEGYTFKGWEYNGSLIFDEQGENINNVTLTDNMTFKAKFDANKYTLKVNYFIEDTTTSIAAAHQEMVVFGSNYSITSPVIEGYTADKAIVTGIMDSANGKVINVYYTPNDCPLTINYYIEGTSTPITSSYQGFAAYGKNFNIPSPFILGYRAETESISGIMDSLEGKTINVYYSIENYTLRINYYYVHTQNSISTTFDEELVFNAAYSITSPVIEGYTADLLIVSGTMNEVNGKVINVYYTPNNYDLTINYYYVDTDDDITEAHTSIVAFDADYSINSPVIEGYTADKAIVLGIMDEVNGKVINVYYTPNNYNLIINYYYVDTDDDITEAHSSFVAFDADYSINSPVIEGYTADLLVVSGTMDDVNGKVINVYYIVTPRLEFASLEFEDWEANIELSYDQTTFDFNDEITAFGSSTYVIKDTLYEMVELNVANLEKGNNTFYIVESFDGGTRNYTVNIYLKSLFTITFDTDGGSEFAPIYVQEGDKVTIPNEVPTLQGYTFDTWDFNFDTIILGDTTILALYNPNMDTPYTVKHYQENINDDGYTLFETENLTGITDFYSAGQIKQYPHFTFDNLYSGNVLNSLIKPDGSTVVEFYYQRERFTISANNKNHDTIIGDIEIDNPKEKYKYMEPIKVTATPRYLASFVSFTYKDDQGNSVTYDTSNVLTINITSNIFANFTTNTFLKNWNYIIGTDNEITLTDYYGDEASIVIPYYVTHLGDSSYLFYGEDISSLIIQSQDGKSLKSIYERAFYGVSSLTSITFAPDSKLESIGGSAFSGTGIKTLDLPSSIKTIGDSAFYNCSSLESVTFNEGLESIGNLAFSGTAITQVILPDSITTLGYSIFNGCNNIKIIVLPSHIGFFQMYFGGNTPVELTVVPTYDILDSTNAGIGIRNGKILARCSLEEYEELYSPFYAQSDGDGGTYCPQSEKSFLPENVYFYSETSQAMCWHFVNGIPTLW